MLALYYRNEPRVHVDTSPNPYRYYTFGRVLLGVNHGDGAKLAEMGEVMAADVPDKWGYALHRHIYSGHLHHTQIKELRGCTVETIRSPAAKDAWSNHKGYRSGRSVFADTWHAEKGFRSRVSVGIEELGRTG
jgi:hypothetical protein